MMELVAMSKAYLLGTLSVVLAAAPVHAEPAIPAAAVPGSIETPLPSLRWCPFYDGGAVAVSLGTVALSQLISVDTSTRWGTQLLPIDDHLKGHYSSPAAKVSDILVAVDVASPVALFAGRGFDRETAKRVGIYTETLLVGLAVNSVVKSLVGRPRPYVYSDNPEVMAYAEGEGRDTHQSFYSLHSSTTFSAAVAGAYLFAQSTSDLNARAAVWGVGLALAAATADLRTRAGMHFYSDVLVGATIGTGLGVLIPYLHGGPKLRLSKREWAAIALGTLAGVALGEFMPVGR
jgi:membrane-associated phospholipid phosphatase